MPVTLYDILGISSSSSQEEIKAAYKTLAKKHHPDKNPGSEWHEEQFKKINHAYQILSVPHKKRQYDYQLEYERFIRESPISSRPENFYRKPPVKKTQTEYKRPVYSYNPRSYTIDAEEKKINYFVVAYYTIAILSLGFFYSYRDTLEARDYFETAQGFEKKGNYSEALSYYTKAVSLDEEYTEAYERRGMLWIKAYKNTGEALDDYTKAIKTSYKPDISLVYKRVKCYFELKKYQLALDDINYILNEEEKIDSLFFYKAESNFHTKKYKEAIPDYSKFLSTNKNSEESYLNRGYSFYMNKDYKNALSDYNIAIAKRPETAENYYHRGFINFALKDSTQGCLDMHDAFLLGYTDAVIEIKKYCPQPN